MPTFKTIGPRVGQLVLYQDGTYGIIPAIITSVNSGPTQDGGVALTTFPPGVSPAIQTDVFYDYTGTVTGRWRYEDPDVQ